MNIYELYLYMYIGSLCKDRILVQEKILSLINIYIEKKFNVYYFKLMFGNKQLIFLLFYFSYDFYVIYLN